MTFLPDTLTQLHLPIAPTVQAAAWRLAQSGSTPRAIWQIYLNQICLRTFLPWLQTEHAPQASEALGEEMGEWVNGIAINLDPQRLIVIPEKTIDTDELRVPQEWVDLPDWAGDYYLAAQVDPDGLSVRIWGYTTHAKLRSIGQYEADDRTYCLDGLSLIQDLSVLWVVRQMTREPATQSAIAPLPTLPPVQAENLVQRLANPALRQPRLEIPFSLWGSLLQQPARRQQLRQLRQSGGTEDRRNNPVVNLAGWLQNQFSVGWQALEAVLTPEDLAMSLRQTAAAATEIRRVKVLQLPDQGVLLSVGLTPEPDDHVSVRVQLRPRDRPLFLLADLTLSLLSSEGELVQAVTTRSQDNFIQLRRFRCAAGTEFRVQVAIESAVITETFCL
jgi:Protein of unknown function (DUF1822)